MLKSCLLGATHFSLPATTSGLQKNFGTNTPNLAYINEIPYEHVVVPNTNCDLYFPTDGAQPDTTDAGIWSGARYIGQPNDSEVTDWWVRVFGGNKAVNFSDVGQPRQPKEPKMGFDNGGVPEVIIKLGSPGLRKQFWRTFRDIAADPVGRVLLYRLLIEIRRVDDSGNGCCENGITLPPTDLTCRNKCRHLTVTHNNKKSSFNFTGATLKLNPATKQHRVLKKIALHY